MQKMNNFIRNLENLELIAKKAISNSMDRHLDDFAQMQRDRLNEGKNNEGDLLRRKGADYYPYSPSYTPQRKKKGLQTQHVDLNVDETYHAKITAKKMGATKLFIYSTDFKDDFLPDQYNGVYGFSPDQRKQVKDFMNPEINAEITREIQKI